jgi:hypothetical protein
VTPDRFPVLRGYAPRPIVRFPTGVPWALVEPHRAQAPRNHFQTLERLAERGGLAPSELVAVLEDRPWHAMNEAEAADRLRELGVVEGWP